MHAVSICIPAYNAARYLPTSIQSVLEQDFSDYEVVICDDGSTDNTQEVCARYADPRIRYLKFPNGGGQAANFNRCLEHASGEFLLLLHADDYLLPGYLTQRVGALRANPELVLATGPVTHVNDAGEQLGVKRDWETEMLFPEGSFVRELLLACMVVPVSMVFRREAAQKIGPFRTDIVWGPDWEWALRLVEQGGVFYGADALAAYRVHTGSGTASAIKAGRNGADERIILGEAFARAAKNEKLAPDLDQIKTRALWNLSLRHIDIAEAALLAGSGRLCRQNLRWSVQASANIATRPTYWAMLLGSLFPAAVFGTYRKLRPRRDANSSAVQLSA